MINSFVGLDSQDSSKPNYRCNSGKLSLWRRCKTWRNYRF